MSTTVPIPNNREEDWRYADPSPLQEFQPAEPVNGAIDPSDLPAPHIIVSNGAVALQDHLPAGISVHTSKEPQEFPGWSGTAEKIELRIEKDQVEAINIQELINGGTHVGALQVAIKAGVSAKINIARLHQAPAKNGCTRTVTVERDANLAIHEFDIPVVADSPELVGISLVNKTANLAENAHLSYVTGTRGGVLVRHRFDAHIDGEHAEAHLTGASVVNGDRQAHHLVRLFHHVGNNSSRQTFTSIADDTSRTSFDGMVTVDQGADGTDAEQSNRNMSLSPKARIATRPQLDVYADDVAAGHGATIGAPQEQEIQYLRTRGLTRKQARTLLIQGFAREPLGEIRDSHMQAWADKALLASLRIEDAE